MDILNELKNCANELDNNGFTKEADALTKVMVKIANLNNEDELAKADEEVQRILLDEEISDVAKDWLVSRVVEVGAPVALQELSNISGDLDDPTNDETSYYDTDYADFVNQEVDSMNRKDY